MRARVISACSPVNNYRQSRGNGLLEHFRSMYVKQRSLLVAFSTGTGKIQENKQVRCWRATAVSLTTIVRFMDYDWRLNQQ
jgi:hypothetical protein